MGILVGSRFLLLQILRQQRGQANLAPLSTVGQLSALPLLHRNCPLPQTPPQIGVPSRSHLYLLILFPRPSLSGGPSQRRSPLWPKKDQLAAEMLKSEPLRHRHPKVMLLPWGLGWELRQDQRKPAGKPFGL
ncbi:hypothetical protein HJG60_008750 [Phyllostomus discolor]|uniref:Uncharacterized protein n=1 Tax=Phyllostomus discolor TaxID=89673 RepID=A0A834DIW4_9CHIR|nr:hypothetical protein HJG60_008750 [Phyllostomus discolor]